MANIPFLNADGEQIGTIPNRSSKNPVIGVIRCDCGEPATVHNPRGKRSGRYYTMCDCCGTDQRAGDTRQAKIRAEMVQTIEELTPLVNQVKYENIESDKAVEAVKEAEKAEPEEAPQAAENAVSTVNEPETETPPKETENLPHEKPNRILTIFFGGALGAVLAAVL